MQPPCLTASNSNAASNFAIFSCFTFQLSPHLSPALMVSHAALLGIPSVINTFKCMVADHMQLALFHLQTSAWSSQKTASRLCKAALLLQYHQLTASVAQLWPAHCAQPLETSPSCSCEQQQQATSQCTEGLHDTTATAAGAYLTSAATSGSYRQCKEGSQDYATQWQDLQTQHFFVLWKQKPDSL